MKSPLLDRPTLDPWSPTGPVSDSIPENWDFPIDLNSFPPNGFIARESSGRGYFFTVVQGMAGLAYFSTVEAFDEVTKNLNLTNLTPIPASFDEARDIVKQSRITIDFVKRGPMLVTCVIYLDNVVSPKVHQVL